MTPREMRLSPRAAILGQVVALRAQADALEALALAIPDGDPDDPLLDLGNVEAEGVSPHTARSWIRSGRLEAHQAERGRFVFRRSALLRALEASPARRSAPKPAAANDDDAWDRAADAEMATLRRTR